jgi:hypothetical protein
MPLELFLQASPACARLARTIAGFVFEPSFGVLPCCGSIRLRRKKICVKRNFLLASGVVGCIVVLRTSKQGDEQMSKEWIAFTSANEIIIVCAKDKATAREIATKDLGPKDRIVDIGRL